MNRPGGDVALEPGRYLAEHRSTIGFIVEPDYRQEHRLFERAKDVGHCDYIVAIRASPSTRGSARGRITQASGLAQEYGVLLRL